MMKKLRNSFLAVGLLFIATWDLRAQEPPDKLTAARDKIEREFRKRLPEWKRTTVEPVEGSKHVIIDHWESDILTVNVAILLHDSEKDANDSFKRFKNLSEIEEQAARKAGKKNCKIIKDELPYLADGGFTWETYGSVATSFRKGNYTIHIAVVRPQLSHDVLTSRRFADLIAEILSGK